jgi:hypothetical protein
MLELSKIYINFMKREIIIVMSFPGWWKGKNNLKRLEIYIMEWN